MIGRDLQEGSPEWHHERLLNVGGSEIAGLFALAPSDRPEYIQSPYTLHMVKAGRVRAPHVDDSPGSRIWFGRMMEPKIAEMAAIFFQWEVEKGGYCVSPHTPGMACSLDYVIARPTRFELDKGCTGPGILQLKNSDWLQHKRSWTAGEPPLWIVLQLQHEIDCSGCTWGVICCLVGNNELKRYVYRANPRVAGALRDKVTEFWEGVRAGRVPNTDGTQSTADTLRELYQSIVPDVPVIIQGERIQQLCHTVINAVANLRESRRQLRIGVNELEEELKGVTIAECIGYRIAVAVTPERKARPATPGEIMKGRQGSRRISVTEVPIQ
jgi:hypothetical protein